MERKDLIEQIANIIPMGKEEEYYQFFRRMRVLLPLGEKNKLGYLVELMGYTDSLINGDSIEQMVTSTCMIKYAKEALKEVADTVRDSELDFYRAECAELTKTNNTLRESKEHLERELSTLNETLNFLRQSVDSLEKKESSLKQSVNEKNSELISLKEKGMEKVELEVLARKELLESELQEYSSKKEAIKREINSLKKAFNDYNDVINKINAASNGQKQVTWKNLAKDDPIYSTNYRTIRNYVESLKITYMNNMGVSRETCEREFRMYCPCLEEFQSLLETFTNENASTYSVDAIIHYGRWNVTSQNSVNTLSSMLKLMKMPVYNDKKNSDGLDNVSQEKVTNSDNFNAFLREMFLQRRNLELKAKLRITEAELEFVLKMLKKGMGEECLLSYFDGQSDIELDLIGKLDTLEEVSVKKKSLK